MCLSDSIAGFGVFRHGHGPAKGGSSSPRSRRSQAVLSSIALWSGADSLCAELKRLPSPCV